jgi:hypothetical protein
MKKLTLLPLLALAGLLVATATAQTSTTYYDEEATIYFTGTAYYTYTAPSTTVAVNSTTIRTVRQIKLTTADIIAAIGNAQGDSFSSTAKLVYKNESYYVVDGTTSTVVTAGYILNYLDYAENSVSRSSTAGTSYDATFLTFYRLQVDNAAQMVGRAAVPSSETLLTMDIYGMLNEAEVARNNAAVSYDYYSSKGTMQGTYTSTSTHGVVIGTVLRVPKLVRRTVS